MCVASVQQWRQACSLLEPLWSAYAQALEMQLAGATPRPPRRTSDRQQRNRRNYLSRKLRLATAKLKALRESKRGSQDHRASATFAAKVALAPPATSARGFSDAWKGIAGTGSGGLARPTIDGIKDFERADVRDKTHVVRVRVDSG